MPPPPSKEKESEAVKKKDDTPATSEGASDDAPVDTIKEEIKVVIMSETKPKRKLESGREGKVRAKKVKATAIPHTPESDVNDNNNNNNSDIKAVARVCILMYFVLECVLLFA